jgi:putative transposase
MAWTLRWGAEERWALLQALSRAGPGEFKATCERLGVSRSTGYKWRRRFLRNESLSDRSTRPKRLGRSWADCFKEAVRRLRVRDAELGARKLRWHLGQLYPRRRLPSARTIHRWLKEVDLVRPVRWRAPVGPAARPLFRTKPSRCNAVWSIDFKGDFHTGDGTRIHTLTVRDMFSRYLLAVKILPDLSAAKVRQSMTKLFKECGLPRAIRCDRGAPFFGPGTHGWTRLSTWWIRLGIKVQFTRRAKSYDNGSHEQMHRILKAATARPPAATLSAQRARFVAWRIKYNHRRPHASLGERPPATRYQRSTRTYPNALPDLVYPAGWSLIEVNQYGYIYWKNKKRSIGVGLAGQPIGLRPVALGAWVYLGRILLGSLPLHSPGLHPSVSYRRGG